MWTEIIDASPEMEARYGPLAFISADERQAIFDLPFGRAKAAIAQLDDAVWEDRQKKKKRGRHE